MTISLFIKIILISGLFLILYQDVKERAVWWFLFPLFALSAGYLHFRQSLVDIFLHQILINFSIVLILFSGAFIYSRHKIKVNFFEEAIGLGDLLFFLGLAVAFPSEAFMVILVFSMIFSLLLHVFVSRTNEMKTVPLAGYASLFLISIYLSNWLGLYKNLYFLG